MDEKTVTYKVLQPSVEEYESVFSKMPVNSEKKERIFKLLTEPRYICEALVFTESTGSSPIAYYEKRFHVSTALKKFLNSAFSEFRF